MKKIIYLWFILLFSFGLAIGQTKGKATVREPIVVSQFAEAEKSWMPYWSSFLKAVKANDQMRFFPLISRDFDASGLYMNNEKCRNLKDKRSEFFCILKEQGTDLTNEFEWVFRKKTRIGKVGLIDKQITRNVEWQNDTYRFAKFIYALDGNWYIIDLGSGGA